MSHLWAIRANLLKYCAFRCPQEHGPGDTRFCICWLPEQFGRSWCVVLLRMKSIEERREARLIVDIEGARLREAGASGTSVGVYDLSPSGFRTEWPYRLRVGDRVWLTLPGLEAQPATVRWTEGFAIGCQFERPIHPSVFDHLLRGKVSRQNQLR